jgi:Flp pilus assembly pilin Flp
MTPQGSSTVARKSVTSVTLRVIAIPSRAALAHALRFQSPSGRSRMARGCILRTSGFARREAARGRNVMDLINRFRAFARNDEAQDLIEYALLVGLISLVAVAAIGLAGTSVNTIFGNIAAQLGLAAGA